MSARNTFLRLLSFCGRVCLGWTSLCSLVVQRRVCNAAGRLQDHSVKDSANSPRSVRLCSFTLYNVWRAETRASFSIPHATVAFRVTCNNRFIYPLQFMQYVWKIFGADEKKSSWDSEGHVRGRRRSLSTGKSPVTRTPSFSFFQIKSPAGVFFQIWFAAFGCWRRTHPASSSMLWVTTTDSGSVCFFRHFWCFLCFLLPGG